jgi:hypothetical protein
MNASKRLMQAEHSHHLGPIALDFKAPIDSIKRLQSIAGFHERRIEDGH